MDHCQKLLSNLINHTSTVLLLHLLVVCEINDTETQLHVSTAHAQWEGLRGLQLPIKNGKVVRESYRCWRQLITSGLFFMKVGVENSHSWTEINISYKIFDLVLRSQIKVPFNCVGVSVRNG